MGLDPYVNIIGKNSAGVPTILPAEDRAFHSILYQTDEATTFDEFNLVQAIWNDRLQRFGRQFSLAGWVDPGAFITPGDTNVFYMPKTNIMVNGNPLTIADPDGTGERVSISLTSSATRRDIIFLEVWLQEVAPSGSAEVDDEDVRHYGGDDNVALSNDILRSFAPDRNGSKETTRRVQIRWRIREVTSIDFTTFPPGMTDPLVLAQGGTGAPVAGKTFTVDPDDANLWVAGTGSEADGIALDSVDGKVYAIRIADLTRTAADEAIDAAEINADLRDQATINLNLIQLITEVDSANPWRMFFGDAASDIQEIALGSSGQVLTSAGSSAAPSFAAPPDTPLNLSVIDFLESELLKQFIALGPAHGDTGQSYSTGDHVGLGWVVRQIGSGEVNAPGTTIGWQVDVGSVANDDAGFVGPSWHTNQDMTLIWVGDPASATGASANVFFGLKPSANEDFSDVQNIIGFRKINTGNVFGVCDSGGTETTRDSTVAGGVAVWRIDVRSGGTIVRFFRNGTQIGADVTTNVHQGVKYASCGLTCTVGSTQRTITIQDLNGWIEQ